MNTVCLLAPSIAQAVGAELLLATNYACLLIVLVCLNPMRLLLYLGSARRAWRASSDLNKLYDYARNSQVDRMQAWKAMINSGDPTKRRRSVPRSLAERAIQEKRELVDIRAGDGA